MSADDKPDVPDAPDVSDPSDVPDASGEGGAPRVARAGSAAAAAASRARRIGGRASTARPPEAVASKVSEAGSADDIESPTTESTPTGTVRLRKVKKSDRPADSPVKVPFNTYAASDIAGSDPGPGGTPGSKAIVRWAPAVALTTVLIVFAVLVAVSTHGSRWDRPSGGAARDQVLAAAKSCVVATNSYAYDKLDAFEKKGLACATGAFATQFAASVNKILKAQAPKVKQQQSLQVNTAGIVDISNNNQWDILIYGQISVTNTSTTSARLDPFGAVAHLKKVGGAWRISSLCSQSLGGTTDACY